MGEARQQTERATLLRESAAELATDELRLEFLRAVCADDPELLDGLIQTITLGGTSPETEGDNEPAPAFSAGDLVAGRFEIRGPLGSGGMGVVYEAVDRKLMERRALKFSRAGHLQRIPEEARTGLRITHENICRIYEIHSAATEGGPADFISMELVDGESLSDRIRRDPPSKGEALDIARQLCHGLSAAHSGHVLHLDLKTNNVMLARRPDGGMRVVIMDFGLALPLGHAGKKGGAVAGTPNYIAPERWRGAGATPACDVYALGVILYELLTARLPFPAGTPWAERVENLPEAPSRVNRGVDARWNAIVLRCLEPDPARRFADAAAVSRAIERTFGAQTRRRILLAAAVCVAAAAPVVAFRDRIWPPPTARLAVLPPEGSSGSPAVDQGLRGALYDIARRLASQGASAKRLVAIPFEDTVRSGVSSPAAAASKLGATHVLQVRLAGLGGGFAVDADVRDARTGISVRRFRGNFRTADLASLPVPLVGVVASAFHLPRAPEPNIQGAAYAAYAAGLSRLRAEPPAPDEAIAEFNEALQKDAAAVPALVGLADAYLQKYRLNVSDGESLAAADTAARRAYSLQPDSAAVLTQLAAVERLHGRAERAIDLMHRATELEPENPDVWRQTGNTLQQLGRDSDAVEALRRAVELATSYSMTHRDLGAAYFRMGRMPEAAQQLRIVTQLAPGFSEGFSLLGATLFMMDRDKDAEVALRESIRLQPTRGTLNNLAVVLRGQGRDREAAELFQQALKSGMDGALERINLGNALAAAGDTTRARTNWQKAGELARAALRRNARDAQSRVRLGYSMIRLGQTELGADEVLQAVQLAPTDYTVFFWATMGLEAAHHRDEIFPLLATASTERLRNLRRQPELAGLVTDSRFVSLMQQASNSAAERK